MASIDLDRQSDDFVNTDDTPPSLSDNLEKVGPRNVYVLFQAEESNAFFAWWQTTPWVRGVLDSRHDITWWKKKIGWSKTHCSTTWQSFHQVAHTSTGEPGLLCIHCDTRLRHPNAQIKPSHGTSGQKQHIQSRDCVRKKTSSENNETLRQATLTASASV
jgi:L-rhamnose mutarotase